MSRGEAVKLMKAKLECLTRDVHADAEICRPELCESCNLHYEQGTLGEQKEWLRMAIKALSRRPIEYVLDQIKAEIWMEGMNMAGEYKGVWIRFKDIEEIIDKHIKEEMDDGKEKSKADGKE